MMLRSGTRFLLYFLSQFLLLQLYFFFFPNYQGSNCKLVTYNNVDNDYLEHEVMADVTHGHTKTQGILTESGESLGVWNTVSEFNTSDQLFKIDPALDHVDKSLSLNTNNNQTYAELEEFIDIIKRKLEEPSNLIQVLKQSKKEKDSLFFNVDFTEELRYSVKGSVKKYDMRFKNPCWLANMPNKTYTGNPYYTHKVYGCPARETFRWINTTLASRKTPGLRVRCLPYFYLAGTTKSGTTDLFAALTKHPAIASPVCKEPLYWNRARMALNISFSHYVDTFDTIGVHNYLNTEHRFKYITGDASPAYLWDFYPWRRLVGNRRPAAREPRYILAHTIRAITPEAKLLIILRQPSERLYSHFRMWFENKNDEDFHMAVINSLHHIYLCVKMQSLRSCVYEQGVCHAASDEVTSRVCRFIVASMYYIHLKDWLDVFPRQQVHVIKAEDYFSNRFTEIKKILNFFEIETAPKRYIEMLSQKKPMNQRTKRDTNSRGMLTKTREVLDQFYAPFNYRLSELLHDTKWLWMENV